MSYTTILTCNFGSHQPDLADVVVDVNGSTISSGITAIAGSNGSGFQVTATLADGFRGPFVFRDDTDATKFCIGNVGPEHELLDAAITSRSDFDHTTDEVITNAASRTASQADVSGLPTASQIVDAITAAEIAVAVESSITEAGDIRVIKNERLTFVMSGLTIPADYGRCVLTIAKSLRDSDDESILQADSATGLLRLNGEAAGPAGATLSVDQPGGSVSGDILVATVAALATKTVLYYDIKHMSPSSGPKRLAQGRVIVGYTPGKTLS